mmetsp:Transcript_23199/g.45027  ORF Transcript_23199/g.45027 Transcript_23199/m.45027 type:complete len:155 (-) Transcript_23199:361-825(-)
MLQHWRAEQLALAVLLSMSCLAHGEVSGGALGGISGRGPSPAFQHHAVGVPASPQEEKPSSSYASRQDAPEPRSVGKVMQGGRSPPVELRMSSLPPKKALNVDTRMHFFSIPVGTKAPEARKQPEVHKHDTMKFYSIPVGSCPPAPKGMLQDQI